MTPERIAELWRMGNKAYYAIVCQKLLLGLAEVLCEIDRLQARISILEWRNADLTKELRKSSDQLRKSSDQFREFSEQWIKP